MSFVKNMSPCIGMCKLDTRGMCVGCMRSIREIANWSQLSIQERKRIMERILRMRGEAPEAEAAESLAKKGD